MADKCLVSKFNGVAGDLCPLKLGHFYINVPAGSVDGNNGTRISYRPDSGNVPLTVTIISDGYFTDASWTENLGKSLSINTYTSSTYLRVYSQNGCKVDVPDMWVGSRCAVTCGALEGGINYRIQNYVDGINGDVADGEDVDITAGYKIEVRLGLVGSGVHGDMTNSFVMSPDHCLAFTRLNRLFAISEKGITFNAAVFKINNNVGRYGCGAKYVPLYWESDPTNDTIPGVYQIDFGNYLDTALIEMASRTGMIPVSEDDRKIIIKGSKSALSDAAVTTLKQKGFSVTINEIPY